MEDLALINNGLSPASNPKLVNANFMEALLLKDYI